MFLHTHLCASQRKLRWTLRLSLCIHGSVCLSRNDAVIHLALICIPGQKKLSDSVTKHRFPAGHDPSIATFLYVSILRPPASLPNSPDNYGPASTEHTSTSSLNTPFSFSPSLSFCLSLSLSSYIVGEWPIALAIREVRVYDLLNVPACVWAWPVIWGRDPPAGFCLCC